MSVWLIFPSCNPSRAQRTVDLWHKQGYLVAVHLDPDIPPVSADLVRRGPYPGYWRACNDLILTLRDQALTFVLAADDMEPDPIKPADIIAEELYRRFPDGYCVMQPIGDTLNGTDRICGSPWFGHGWINESYNGQGPCPLDYKAFFGDEELLNVAKAQKVLWQRLDLCQKHNHWLRTGGPAKLEYQSENGKKYWEPDKALYHQRMLEGFPGSNRLPPSGIPRWEKLSLPTGA